MRLRRVRREYPPCFVALVVLLCKIFGVRETLKRFGVRPSSGYRWLSRSLEKKAISLGEIPRARIAALVDECESEGFEVQNIVAGLLPQLRLSSSSLASRSQTDGSADAALLEEGRRKIIRKAPKTSLLDQAKENIECRYAEKWSCAKLARSSGYSKFDFIRSFKKAFGISPYQYLIEVRTNKALALLKNSTTSLAAVAKKSGFGSASAMQRSFCHVLGASPSYVINNIASDPLLAARGSVGVTVSTRLLNRPRVRRTGLTRI